MVFQTTLILILSILLIIILSSVYKINTFFVLLFIAILAGVASGQGLLGIINSLKIGFGHTLEKVGLLVILGTVLGLMLEKSNATLVISTYIIDKVGAQNSILSVSIIGFLVGLPIFCDSAFIVLNGMILSLGNKLNNKHFALTTCLAGTLLSVHCMVPPHPGIAAAAGTFGVDMGKALLFNTLLSIPACILVYFWSKKFGNINYNFDTANTSDIKTTITDNKPSISKSMLPIIIPIVLIALKSIALLKVDFFNSNILTFISFVGEPIVALIIGILLAIPMFSKSKGNEINQILEQAIEKAGPILAIIAAGGAFGEIIKAMDIGKVYGTVLLSGNIGLFAPFLLSAIFKTAQGSSTVAAISTSSILLPLLPALGLDSEMGRILALAAVGAGSMFFSHANDAYFWVISRFAQIPPKPMFTVYSPLTALMGLVTFLFILLSQWMLM